MKQNGLPLSVTLRDLAVLRASDVDLSKVLDLQQHASDDESLQRSVEFAKEARAALRTANSGIIDQQGTRIEEIRALGDQLLEALGKSDPTRPAWCVRYH